MAMEGFETTAKTPQKGQKAVQDQSMTTEKSWVMMDSVFYWRKSNVNAVVTSELHNKPILTLQRKTVNSCNCNITSHSGQH